MEVEDRSEQRRGAMDGQQSEESGGLGGEAPCYVAMGETGRPAWSGRGPPFWTLRVSRATVCSGWVPGRAHNFTKRLGWRVTRSRRFAGDAAWRTVRFGCQSVVMKESAL